jgi:Rod binding domain-containing protein
METQGYKNDSAFTLPLQGMDITRTLFERRLETIEEVINDPEAKRVFSRAELAAMAFESLMLAKMLKSMPEASYA